jgi:hypothetical protein
VAHRLIFQTFRLFLSHGALAGQVGQSVLGEKRRHQRTSMLRRERAVAVRLHAGMVIARCLYRDEDLEQTGETRKMGR